MGYTKEQRIDIGRQIYTGEISKQEAMDKYDVCETTTENYVIAYKEANGIPVFRRSAGSSIKFVDTHDCELEMYHSMSKEELIQALILSKANELRAKKGYEVKGVGQKKEFISLSNKNSK